MRPATTALLNRLGFLHEIYGRLPRVHIEADFLQPLRFKDRRLRERKLRIEKVSTASQICTPSWPPRTAEMRARSIGSSTARREAKHIRT